MSRGRSRSPFASARARTWLAFAFLPLLAASLLQGQGISEDEIRTGSRPYTPRAPANLRVQTNLVEVGVVVRDASGKPVQGLSQSDFQVLDNGKPQTISVFSIEKQGARLPADAAASAPAPAVGGAPPPSRNALPPRYVGLFFDDWNLPVGDLVPARVAAERFVNENLEPGDRVAVFTTSTTVTLEFTQDKQKVLAALAQLRTHQRRADHGAGSCPRMSPYQAYLIVNHLDQTAHDLAFEQAIQCQCIGVSRRNCDLRYIERLVQTQAGNTLSLTDHFAQDAISILNDVIRYLGQMKGKRMLVLASSGFLTRSQFVQQKQDKLVDAALRADVVINALDAKGLTAAAPGGDPADGPPIVIPSRPDLNSFADTLLTEQREAMNDPMAILAEGTGGVFFHNSNDLNRGIREVAAPPEVSYILGISPENLKADGSFHALKVKLTSPGKFTIEARRGYFAPPKSPAPVEPSAEEKLDAQVLGSETLEDVPSQVTMQSEKLENGETVLHVVVHVDLRGLPFGQRDGRHVEKLRLVSAVFDAKGKFMTGAEAGADLAFKDQTLPRLLERGLEFRLSLQASPGSYVLREVVQELEKGKMSAQSRPVEIR